MEVGKPYLYHDGGGLWLDAFSGGAYALCQKVAGEYDHVEKGDLPSPDVCGLPAVFLDNRGRASLRASAAYVPFAEKAAVPAGRNGYMGCGHYGGDRVLRYDAFGEQYV